MFLEQLTEASSVVFSKTGTLTIGELALAGFRASSKGEEAVDEGTALRLAGALGAASSHPVSRAASARRWTACGSWAASA